MVSFIFRKVICGSMEDRLKVGEIKVSMIS